jgi:chorismate dehydratase
MDAKIRIGAVSYLNTRPLVFGMAQGLGVERIELTYDVPSVLACRMAAEELDVALLPTIELAHIPDLAVVSGLAIGSKGNCRSVLLVARKSLDEIRSVALDPESRTSNALAQILCAGYWGISPNFAIGPCDLDTALREHDAVVRIGDKALFEPLPAGTVAYDLGGAWTAYTGLPFIFAVWASRFGAMDRDLYETLHASRRSGTKMLKEIADDYTWNGNQYPQISLTYLQDAMRYRLGSEEVRGLQRFLSEALGLKLIERAYDIRFAAYTETRCGV